MKIGLYAIVVPWLAASAFGDDWPQWRGPNRDGVWAESGIIEKFDGPQIALRWRAEISSGYSGPTVADGRVYVFDRVVEPKQIERVHCLDWQTGKEIWTHAYDCRYRGVHREAGPRASVTIHSGLAYSLGTMGHLFCLDAATGRVVWSKDPGGPYKVRVPTWGVAASPLVEGDLVIVQIGGEDGACLVAFDRNTGQERWRALDDPPSYSSPIVTKQTGRRVLICWTGARVVGLDPSSGKLYWEYPFPPKSFIRAIATPVVEGDRLFLSGFFDGSLMLRFGIEKTGVEKIWQRRGPDEFHTEALHTNISTCLLMDEHVYGVDSYGELRCLNARTGERIWESLEATPKRRWSNIFFVRNGEKVWMFNECGELIISTLSPAGFQEIGRAKLIAPTKLQLPERREGVCWSHPAFAYRHVFARNDSELVCASLEAKK
jgi:outer membrane protein assembly factor BamB